MPFLHKNIKIFVKNRLEEKSYVLTPQDQIHFAKLFSTSRNAAFSQRQQICQKTLEIKKLSVDPTSLNPLCEIV
jgi:hypothetical protein